jgi:tetratricopeptide (TPR) repeat protein
MDLSKLKWVFIIGIPALAIFLFTGPGVDYIYNSSTEATPGVDAAKDAIDEQKLSTWGGYLLTLFQYDDAEKFYTTAIVRYPEGKNVWWNYYQRARCFEKMDRYREAVDDLYLLWQFDADQFDERVPDRNTLRLRIVKLLEIHSIDPAPYPGLI